MPSESDLRWAIRPSLLAALSVALLAGMLGGAQPAAAQMQVDNGCMQDVYEEYNGGGTLNCTANDVQVASVTNITILDDGCQFVGDTVTFSADYEIELTAQARHDIGIYLATDGSDALGIVGPGQGNCTILTLPIPPTDLDGTGDNTGPTSAFGYCSSDGGTTMTIGTDGLPLPCNTNGAPDCPVGDTCEEFGIDITGPIQDTCGDIDDAPNPIFLTGIVITAVCQDPDGDGRLDLPNCTSWRQPGDNDLCLSPLAAFPGAPSKCSCDPGFDVGICVPGFCDDGIACTDNVCTIVDGEPVCTFPPNDDNCNGLDDQCNNGVCDPDNPDAGTDGCFADPVANSTPCEDGDACTSETGDPQTPDHCFGGECTGIPVDCSDLDDQCNDGVCNADTGACEAI
ncbi:MAG: hypothetical protein ACYSUI_05645, partial [Planctomycetota bacterium]